ncbi:MAG: AAA family ATPase [Leptolyngbyaceae cyanobacterium MO_188.B28]|nr:AAA family ATPase [Leptolyngbyaceae cyanobacterium MO_188.B28]
MALSVSQLFRVCNPSKTLDLSKPEDAQYYIDFSEVRGSDVVNELRRTIVLSEDEPTCQLFTGHIGCGKSTELSRLKMTLEKQGYHVVYFESSEDLDMADVDISDILLAIARQVSRSLEDTKIRLEPTRFQRLLQGTVALLNSEVTGFKLKLPEVQVAGSGMKLTEEVGLTESEGEYSLSFGIGQLTTRAKDSKDIRTLLRQHLEPRVNIILEALNRELIGPAQQQLAQRGKAGLVVMIDNLDRIDNKPKLQERRQPEYLFVDRGDQLKQLQCHIVYTIPLILAFSNEKENLINRFGSEPQILPMVRTYNRNGDLCPEGLSALRQMVLSRAFPGQTLEAQLATLSAVVDGQGTLDTLCLISGGHVRNLLVLLHSCLKKADPPVSKRLLDRVISQRRSEISKTITADEWRLLRQVQQDKAVQGEEEYQTLLRSLFVFEYRDEDQSWFDLNPLLLEAEALRHD